MVEVTCADPPRRSGELTHATYRLNRRRHLDAHTVHCLPMLINLFRCTCCVDISSPRLNNPPLNPLSLHVREGILNSLAQAQLDDAVSMIIITGGGGKSFSAGADIKEMSNAQAIGQKSSLLEVVNAIEECRVPVVAAIGGLALGGGCEVITDGKLEVDPLRDCTV